jgi:two-component system chemotaxis response regulator CheB
METPTPAGTVPEPPGAVARDIVVVGASAGGLEALTALVGGLPADFPGAVFVVLHLPAGARSALPAILARAGPLPASAAAEGAVVRPGRIYVAPTDRYHLVVGRRVTHLVFGPRENGVRPAADPLFRSAARAHGRRVVGVVLSGTGADGTEGLRAIKAAGGLAVVQDPAEAQFAGMPRYAARFDHVDHVLPAARIAPLLAALARGPADPSGPGTGDPATDPPREDKEAEEHNLAVTGVPPRRCGASGFTCPDCRGPLAETVAGASAGFACRIGHRWSGPGNLAAQQALALEALAWGFTEALEERAELLRRIAAEEGLGDPRLAAESVAWAQEAERLARRVRRALPRLL